MDKVDLVLRRRVNGAPVYREVQVKFGKLYRCTQAWERPLFDVSSWRFFKDGEVEDADPGLYLAYVLSEDDEYRGDFFIFPAREFASIIRAAPMVSPSKPKRRVYVSRCVDDPGRWVLRRESRFERVDETTRIYVSAYRRAFDILEP